MDFSKGATGYSHTEQLQLPVASIAVSVRASKGAPAATALGHSQSQHHSLCKHTVLVVTELEGRYFLLLGQPVHVLPLPLQLHAI